MVKMSDVNKDIGMRIRELRELSDITTEEIAKELDVDEETYMKYYLPKFKNAYNYHKKYIEENKLNDEDIFEYIFHMKMVLLTFQLVSYTKLHRFSMLIQL